jgi:SAM-dependent methyltransferase
MPGMRDDTGLGRSIRLLRLFRSEQSDPELYYAALAEDTVRQAAGYCELAGRTVVDIGGGGGWFTSAFRAHGADCFLFEPDPSELYSRKTRPAGAVIADGFWLPVRDGTADLVFSSNVLEHVPDPTAFIEEMIRVTKPGGLIYLAFTNWYSPWGGHEMSPWHFLGPRFAARRYAGRYQHKPKHEVGVNLHKVHIGPTLRALRTRADIAIVDARPRYYPGWSRPLVHVPLLREVATWNLLLIIRRTS